MGNPFLVHSVLSVTDFIAENIDRLSSLDYGNLHRDPAPTKVGKLGVKFLTRGAEHTQLRHTLWDSLLLRHVSVL